MRKGGTQGTSGAFRAAGVRNMRKNDREGKQLNFVSTILYSQLWHIHSLHDWRGCGQARNGDGLQRSLRSSCSQMMTTGLLS